MTARLPLKLGSSDARGDQVTHWQLWAQQYAKAYADLMGPVDGYYGNSDAAFTREMQRRLKLPQTGDFDETTAARVGYIHNQVQTRRKIWIYTAPGSGADWWIGPSFELGEWCKKVLKLNHQPVGFPKGGYLGLMGGDPGLSYLDVIAAEGAELERLVDANPDINDPAVELWFSAYSQSADGMLEAVERLFGDGGKYQHLRPRINGLLLFGNPATPGTGIARKQFPAWLNALTVNINTGNDFYAVADDPIRPLFYEWFIRAETELPFVIYTAQIVIPALLNLIAPVGLAVTSPAAALVLAGATGVAPNLIGTVLGGITSSTERPNPKLIELLSVRGVLTNLPGLIRLLAALPGIQSHGAYHLPYPEFGGRTGIQVACDHVASFRR